MKQIQARLDAVMYRCCLYLGGSIPDYLTKEADALRKAAKYIIDGYKVGEW